MKRVYVLLVLLLSISGLLSACQSDLQTDQQRRPIYLGEPDTAEAHQAVVGLVEVWQGNLEAFCTGTLITPTVVLTAAHCLDDYELTEVQIYFGDDVTGGGVFIDVDHWDQHPDWDPSNPDSPDDIALIRLAEPAPAGILPITPLPESLGLGETDEGADVDLSGFGETEDLTYDVKLHVPVPIGKVCGGPSECPFDGDWVAPRAFGYSQQAGGPCTGDSGGPAFIWRGDFEYVAGVTSYGGDCLDFGVSTTVDRYQTWIEDVAGITGAEDCQAAGDDDGDGRPDCTDPDCADDPCCDDPPNCDTDPTSSDGGCNQSGRSGLPGLPFPLTLTLAILLLSTRWRGCFSGRG